MSTNAQSELDSIIRDLQGVIDGLDSVAAGIRRDFSGIGNERCATCISKVAEHYRDVKRDLQRVDVRKVKKPEKTAGGGGGGGSSW